MCPCNRPFFIASWLPLTVLRYRHLYLESKWNQAHLLIFFQDLMKKSLILCSSRLRSLGKESLVDNGEVSAADGGSTIASFIITSIIKYDPSQSLKRYHNNYAVH